MQLLTQFLIILASSLFCSCNFFTEDCNLLGFTRYLSCTHCKLLPQFDLDVLEHTCLECCNPEEDITVEKQYGKAVLEVCTCKFGAYPQIQAFIKSNHPAKYPNLQIRYVPGLDPIIKLYDRDGGYQETVAIEKWNTDSVDEFLNTYLIKDKQDYLRTNMV